MPTDKEYRAAIAPDGKPFLSFHQLIDFDKAPRLYYYKHMLKRIPDTDTPAMAFGRALHCYVLEGCEIFDRLFLVDDGPINPSTGKHYGPSKKRDEWIYQVEESGREAVTEEDGIKILDMDDSVHAHPLITELDLLSGEPEVVRRRQIDGIWCQCRIDMMGQGWLIDLKTVSDIDQFEAAVWRYNYVRQLAFYRLLAAEYIDACYLIAVEKKPPYRCGVWKPTDEALEDAKHSNELSLGAFASCRQINSWPTGYEYMRSLSPTSGRGGEYDGE